MLETWSDEDVKYSSLFHDKCLPISAKRIQRSQGQLFAQLQLYVDAMDAGLQWMLDCKGLATHVKIVHGCCKQEMERV